MQNITVRSQLQPPVDSARVNKSKVHFVASASIYTFISIARVQYVSPLPLSSSSFGGPRMHWGLHGERQRQLVLDLALVWGHFQVEATQNGRDHDLHRMWASCRRKSNVFF